MSLPLMSFNRIFAFEYDDSPLGLGLSLLPSSLLFLSWILIQLYLLLSDKFDSIYYYTRASNTLTSTGKVGITIVIMKFQ